MRRAYLITLSFVVVSTVLTCIDYARTSSHTTAWFALASGAFAGFLLGHVCWPRRPR